MLKRNNLLMFARYAVFVLLAGVNFSCSKSKVDSKLKVTFSNKSPFLIPGPSTSCTAIIAAASSGDTPAADIGPKYFSITNPVIEWSDTERSVSIILMRVKINSPALGISDYTCGLYEDEIGGFYGTGTNLWSRTLAKATEAGGVVTPATSPAANTLCGTSIKCGGVSPGNDIDGNTSATLEVIAVATEEDGTEIPVRSETTFTVQNLQ